MGRVGVATATVLLSEPSVALDMIEDALEVSRLWFVKVFLFLGALLLEPGVVSNGGSTDFRFPLAFAEMEGKVSARGM